MSSSINETQRKYLRQRLDSMLQQKKAELRDKFTVESPWTEFKAKADYVKKAFAGAGLDFSTAYAQYITTPPDVQFQKDVKEAQIAEAAKLVELKALYNSLMDEIVLGSDADALRNAVDSLANFN